MNSRRFIRSPVRRPVDHGGIVPGSRYHTPRWFHAWSEAGHGLEKIKTTGDAYMVVSGVPEPLPDHAAALGDLALDMRDALVGLADPKGRAVPVRIGIASGPVVAGVVGIRKFFYTYGAMR